jgi:hypothetical protein
METALRDHSHPQPIRAEDQARAVPSTGVAGAGMLASDEAQQPAALPSPVDTRGLSTAAPSDSSILGTRPAKPHRRRWHRLAVALILLVLACGAGFSLYKLIAAKGTTAGPARSNSPAADTDDTAPLKLLIPAYFYPAEKGMTQWERILQSPSAAKTVVILNAHSGPGKGMDLNYLKVVERARQQNVTPIGYVSTQYARRPLDEVKGDVDKWTRFYPGIQGIFFDEQPTSSEQVPYFAALYEHAKKQRGLSLVVTNPGAICAEEYVARPVADVVCLVEVTKDFESYQRPAWTNRYPAERFAALVHKTTTREQMEQRIVEMREKKIGYCFITDAEAPNPWGRLPRYWDAEVEAVRRANHSP